MKKASMLIVVVLLLFGLVAPLSSASAWGGFRDRDSGRDMDRNYNRGYTSDMDRGYSRDMDRGSGLSSHEDFGNIGSSAMPTLRGGEGSR